MSLYKWACRLSNSKRFANLKLDKEYSGAEHCFRVAILAMTLADDYQNRTGKKLNVEEILRKAILHDIEEAILGDIPTPVKNRSQDFKNEYKKLAEVVMNEDILPHSPNPETYLKLWKEDKDGESGEVIILADGLEALSTAYYELKRGNMSLKKAFKNLKATMESEKLQILMDKYPLAREFYNRHINLPKTLQKWIDSSSDEYEY